MIFNNISNENKIILQFRLKSIATKEALNMSLKAVPQFKLCHSFNHKLGRAIQTHDYHSALKILNMMKNEHCMIEPAQYSLVLKLYCDEEMLKRADKWVAAHAENMTAVEANAVLHVHCRKDDLQGALNFFKSMKDLGINHDDQSYLEIIRLLAKRNEFIKCLEYLFRMGEEGLVPNLATYTDVIYCLARCHKYKEAKKLYRDMLKKSIKPDTIIENLILEIATLSKDRPLIDELVQEMWEKGIHIHPQIYDPIRKLENQREKSIESTHLT